VRSAAQGSAYEATSRDRFEFCTRASLVVCFVLTAVAALAAVGAPAADAACPNELLRAGASANLPDCRAYELVTPPRVNGVPEAGAGNGNLLLRFSSPPVTPDGQSYLFTLNSSNIPGTGSNGTSNLYRAQRTEAGWTISRESPGVEEAEVPQAGGNSSDLEYVVFAALGQGTLGKCTACTYNIYVRYPDGSFHLLGEGTVPVSPDEDGLENGFIDDFEVEPRWITPGGTHQIFQSSKRLVAAAPETGAFQVYDRTPTGLQLISWLPGEVPPTAESEFAGSSKDGSTVLFLNEGNLFARLDNERTVEVASASAGIPIPGGVSADGSRIFYVQEGTVSVYSVATETSTALTGTGSATLVHASEDGTHAFFVSESEIIPGQGTPNAPNLYAWDGTSIKFIGTLVPSDLGENNPAYNAFKGLALWTRGFIFGQRPAAENANQALNTARATTDGNVFVFESSAQLTPYPNEGHVEVYRYEVSSGALDCVSCSPQNPFATANSELVSSELGAAFSTPGQMLEMLNLSSDGSQVVFETKESLLPQDVNGAGDVYEWHAGTLGLISTGHSPQRSRLMGVTPSGNDIFIQTAETLVPQGQEEGGLAIYDARVGGGIASQHVVDQPRSCVGEGCLEQPGAGPFIPTPSTTVFRGSGNLRHRCRHRRQRAHGKKAHQQRPGKRRSCRQSRRGSHK
jgi:hypothetical protein